MLKFRSKTASERSTKNPVFQISKKFSARILKDRLSYFMQPAENLFRNQFVNSKSSLNSNGVLLTDWEVLVISSKF